MLEAGADPSIQALGGGTPLHFAADAGHHEAVELLLDAGVDPFLRNGAGKFPWDLAKQAGFDAIVGNFEALVN